MALTIVSPIHLKIVFRSIRHFPP